MDMQFIGNKHSMLLGADPSFNFCSEDKTYFEEIDGKTYPVV